MRALMFLIMKKMMSSELAQAFASKINLSSVILTKAENFVGTIGNYNYAESNKKNGVQKSKSISREFCIYLRAISEWNLPSNETQRKFKEFLLTLIPAFDWINAEVVLLNAFINFLSTLR